MKDKEKLLTTLNGMCKNTLNETLSIEYIDCGTDYLVARMPVNSRVHQPDGILNGGATMALAESVGSPCSMLAIDTEKFAVRGIEFAANHLRSVRSGYVDATARIVHKGRTLHLVEIRVVDNRGRLISQCKLSNFIMERKK